LEVRFQATTGIFSFVRTPGGKDNRQGVIVVVRGEEFIGEATAYRKAKTAAESMISSKDLLFLRQSPAGKGAGSVNWL
jgi:hypothetical protein